MCEICMGINSHLCPVCGDQLDKVYCPECGGTGSKRFWAMPLRTGKEIEVTMETYMTLPEDKIEALRRNEHYYQYDSEECDFCGGRGEVWQDARGEYHKIY